MNIYIYIYIIYIYIYVYMYVYVYIYTYMNIYLEYLETAYASIIRRERVHTTIIYRDHKAYI